MWRCATRATQGSIGRMDKIKSLADTDYHPPPYSSNGTHKRTELENREAFAEPTYYTYT